MLNCTDILVVVQASKVSLNIKTLKNNMVLLFWYYPIVSWLRKWIVLWGDGCFFPTISSSYLLMGLLKTMTAIRARFAPMPRDPRDISIDAAVWKQAGSITHKSIWCQLNFEGTSFFSRQEGTFRAEELRVIFILLWLRSSEMKKKIAESSMVGSCGLNDEIF